MNHMSHKNNYKDSLNLPETGFPMRGNLAQREPEMLKRWENENLFALVRAAKKGKKSFLLHDGPPYANGDIHIGHAMNKILKDIIIKSKGMSGYDAHYIPGWDCHGLPIELKVEQLLGKANEKISLSEFHAACREYASEQVNKQRKSFIRLGVIGDWDHPYLTMDHQTEANIIRAFSKIIENGHVYKGIKPVYWCTDCTSSLAEAEVEYYDKTSLSIDVRFLAVDPKAVVARFGVDSESASVSVIIWTTTPWTLPANRAIALHPEVTYQLVRMADDYFILAEDLIETAMWRIFKQNREKEWQVIGQCSGRDLEHLRFKHPFMDFDVPIILADYVTVDAGTGAVHTAPAHGPDDFVICQKYGIETFNPVGPDGCYLQNTDPRLDDLFVFKANDVVREILRDNRTLMHAEQLVHSYPCCWRHKTPLIFRSTSQWFISMVKQTLRKNALSAIQKVKWIPHWGQARIESMVTHRPDWCISRQRTWGVPMSLFIHKETEALHPRTQELMEEVAQRVEKEGIQAWWNISPEEMLGEEAAYYIKVPDTLEVWFDSGSTHSSVVEARYGLNTDIDMCLEGSDQHRGWFMSSLMLSAAMKNKAPYKEVLTHGFVVDGQGRKMSKSIGNTVAPQDVTNKLGADIFRLWVASTDYTSEMAVSDEILQHSADAYRRIRNTARFLLANLKDFDPATDLVSPEDMVMLDRWSVSCAAHAQADIIKAYEHYDFHFVVQRLMQFCSVEMGSFYLDIIKDRQYTVKNDSLARRSGQTALFHIVHALVRWLAPILSFTADEIWQYLPGHDSHRAKYSSVFTQEWYPHLLTLEENKDPSHPLMNDAFWRKILRVRSEVNKVLEEARKNKQIGSSLEASVTLYAQPELASDLNSLQSELRFVLLTSSVRVADYKEADDKAQKTEQLMNELKITINKAQGQKCPRCWHYTPNVVLAGEQGELCPRCVSNVAGPGEERKFA